MGWAAAAAPLVTAATGLFGAKKAGQGADAQGQAAQAGLDFTKGVYHDAQSNFSPYMQAGQGGLSALAGANAGDYSGFQNSPDYLYARDQAIYGNDHSAAAKGRLNSGGYGVDMANSIAGLASQNFGNWAGRQMGMADLGARSTSNLSQIGTSTSQGVQSAYGNIGAAKAEGYGAQAGGIAGLGGAFTNWANGRTPQPATQPANFGIPAMGSSYQYTNYGR